MKETQIVFYVFILTVLVLLIVTMALSAAASVQATKGCKKAEKECHKYSMISAIISGVSFLCVVLFAVLLGYSSRKEISEYASKIGNKMTWTSA